MGLLILDLSTPFPTPVRGQFVLFLWVPILILGMTLYLMSRRLPLRETIRISHKPAYAGELRISDVAIELDVTSSTAEKIMERLEQKGIAKQQIQTDERGTTVRLWIFPEALSAESRD